MPKCVCLEPAAAGLPCIHVCVQSHTCVQSQGEMSSLTAVYLCRYGYELGAEPVLGAGVAKWFKRKGHRLSTNVSLDKAWLQNTAFFVAKFCSDYLVRHAYCVCCMPVPHVLKLCKRVLSAALTM